MTAQPQTSPGRESGTSAGVRGPALGPEGLLLWSPLLTEVAHREDPRVAVPRACCAGWEEGACSHLPTTSWCLPSHTGAHTAVPAPGVRYMLSLLSRADTAGSSPAPSHRVPLRVPFKGWAVLAGQVEGTAWPLWSPELSAVRRLHEGPELWPSHARLITGHPAGAPWTWENSDRGSWREFPLLLSGHCAGHLLSLHSEALPRESWLTIPGQGRRAWASRPPGLQGLA